MLTSRGGLTTLGQDNFQRGTLMEKSKPSSKMFLEIVDELKTLIVEEGIRTGDKLPSERVLAERLQAGRSTIREALRSLELLGLIETRRGEGTFLADFKKHQLVEVLSAFIMQQTRSLLDVRLTRRIHESAAISVVCQEEHLRQLPVWESLAQKLLIEGEVLREDVVREVMIASGNRLSLKIWFLLKQYSRVSFEEMTMPDEREAVQTLLQKMALGAEKEALVAYSQWMDLVEGERKERME